MSRFVSAASLALLIAMLIVCTNNAHCCITVYGPGESIVLNDLEADRLFVCKGGTITFTATAHDNDVMLEPDTGEIEKDSITFTWSRNGDVQSRDDGNGNYVSTNQIIFNEGGEVTISVTAADGADPADDTTHPQKEITVLIIDPVVTLEADNNNEPKLRGESRTVTASVSPTAAKLAEYGAAYTYTWTGVANSKTVTKTGDLSWSGPIVVNTSVTFKASINGLTCEKSSSIGLTITARNWPDSYEKDPQDFTNVPACPRASAHLGSSPRYLNYNVVVGTVEFGPNQGFYLVGICVADITVELWRHSALNSPGHPFYTAQGSNITKLKEDVEYHEGIASCGCHPSHFSFGKDYLDSHPIRSVIEAKVSHVTNETAESFHAAMESLVLSKFNAVDAAAGVEPIPNHWNVIPNFSYDCP